jgi:subtilisin family serine protease
MKRAIVLLTCLVCLFAIAGCVAEKGEKEKAAFKKEVVTPDLLQELEKRKPDEFVRIIVRLKEQFSPAARMSVLAQEGNRKARRQALVNSLRAFTQKSQEPVVAKLKRYQDQKAVKNVRRLWLSNVITMEAKKSVIRDIAAIEGVKYVKQDIRRPVFLQGPSWNVAHINADDVWTSPGYTGNGVVVAVIDTGIDVDHPDLANRLWINAAEDINHDGHFTAADNNGVDEDGNGYIDDVIGWDFDAGDNTPDSWTDHGVHVAGTVAGDGTGGTHTGVAPGARLMTLCYSAQIVAGQAEAWEAMQYALDNGADIVNFSSGWKDAWAPDYETWRDNADVLIDGGVLYVVAAGNDQPHVSAPGDILVPARAPRALAVGAVDNTDTIASFSSQGPTSWASVTNYEDYIYPPGLLKPDVSAPGVSVLSTVDGGGYENNFIWSGTSMASPHVAGVAALLLEKDSTLLPHELMYIIRETAVDLGAVGKDNVYGFGRVDALAAANYNYQHSPVYDLSVTGTNAVWTSEIWVDNNDDGTPDDPVANTDNHLYTRIRNIGGQAVGNVEVKFYYADVGTIGIAGFDPNGDGDPDDGNFTYIDSYFIPVVGPTGSSQAVAEAVVNWHVLAPITDHWCVGIGIVAPNPPNATEINRANNKAFRNFFNIVVTYGQAATFDFLVYPHAKKPFEPFDLQIIRKNLPKEFEIDLVMEKPLADQWLKTVRGFELVKHVPLKNLKFDEESALLRGEKIYAFSRLLEEKGTLGKIVAPEGKPVRVRLVIRAPEKRALGAMDLSKGEHLLIINVADENGPFGGLALNIIFKK